MESEETVMESKDSDTTESIEEQTIEEQTIKEEEVSEPKTKKRKTASRAYPIIPDELRRRSGRSSTKPERFSLSDEAKGNKTESKIKEESPKKIVPSPATTPSPVAKRKKTSTKAHNYIAPKKSLQPTKKRKTAPNEPKVPSWDPLYVKGLGLEHPDSYWPEHEGKIEYINKDHPLKLLHSLHHEGQVFDMQFSNGAELLATCSSEGTIKIWDSETWELIQEIKDVNEPKIEEFYVIQFTPDNKKIFAAGKLKHRDKWSEEDEDHAIAPCLVKIFDVLTGDLVNEFQNHEEEILCLKVVRFKQENYILTASQDGYIIKWYFDKTWTDCIRSVRIDEVTTNMAMSLSFLPGCGNKYFLCAADDGVKIYDFESEIVLQAFEDLYSSYCDCVKCVKCVEMDDRDGEFYLITRGVELLSGSEPTEVLKPNRCYLHRLTVPTRQYSKADAGIFKLDTVMTYQHALYQSNSWPIRITSNGRYIIAPTQTGQVFIWNIRSGELVCILSDHEDKEVREAVFHPYRPYMLTCCDDSKINVYVQENDSPVNAQPTLETTPATLNTANNHDTDPPTHNLPSDNQPPSSLESQVVPPHSHNESSIPMEHDHTEPVETSTPQPISTNTASSSSIPEPSVSDNEVPKDENKSTAASHTPPENTDTLPDGDKSTTTSSHTPVITESHPQSSEVGFSEESSMAAEVAPQVQVASVPVPAVPVAAVDLYAHDKQFAQLQHKWDNLEQQFAGVKTEWQFVKNMKLQLDLERDKINQDRELLEKEKENVLKEKLVVQEQWEALKKAQTEQQAQIESTNTVHMEKEARLLFQVDRLRRLAEEKEKKKGETLPNGS